MLNNGKLSLDKPIDEIIKSRVSVRTYDSRKVPEDTINKLTRSFHHLTGPFGSKSRIVLLDSNTKGVSDLKLGTYGVIKNPPAFLAAAVEKTDTCMEDLGYAFEMLVLHATSLGLGTCWMAGTYNKSAFKKTIGVKENEIMPVISPIGFPAEKRALIDSVMRFAAGSANRKPWKELFFNNEPGCELDKKGAGGYSEALEMVRLAPSASNKQPWRVLKSGNRFIFHIKRNVGYNALGFDMQKLDAGIAMCHFELTAREMGLTGEWSREPALNVPQGLEYVATWVDGV